MTTLDQTGRPTPPTFTKPTCRGCYALGTACGHCEKCAWERTHLLTGDAILTKLTSLVEQATAGHRRAHVDGVVWVVIRDGHVMLERCEKKARKLGIGEWFLPGGKLEAIDQGDPLSALVRELREEWPGVRLEEFEMLPIVEGSRVGAGTSDRGLFLMRPYRIDVSGVIPEASSEGTPLRWAPVDEALASPVPQVRMMVAAAIRPPHEPLL